MIGQVVAGQKECVYIQYKPNRCVIFLSFSGQPSTQECYLKIRAIVNHLAQVLKEYLALCIHIGVSSPLYTMQLCKAYEEAEIAIQESFILPESSIFYYEEMNEVEQKTEFRKSERALEKAITDKNSTQVWEETERFFNLIRASKARYISENKNYLGNLLRIWQGREQHVEDIIVKIQQTDFLDELETVIYTYWKHFQNIEENEESNYLIKKAKQYIQDNYNRMITLTDLADYMGLSESYTSRLFNKEVGMNMSSYINEIRVEKAKELLTHSDEKIYGIAEKIGYASTTAFHVAFKKKTGMTPAEYRNQNYR